MKFHSQTSNESILIADDDKQYADSLAHFLKRCGYTVDTKYNGSEAIKSLRDYPEKYDLILSDIIMPEGDGIEVILFARSNTNAKIISMSGGGVHFTSKQCIEAVRHLTDSDFFKPLELQRILEIIRLTLNSEKNPEQ